MFKIGPEYSSPGSSFADVLVAQGAEYRSQWALLGPGHENMTYGDLAQAAVEVLHSLRSRDVGPSDRVVVVSEGGVDTLVTMLGIMLGSVCVPLDPGLPTEDLERIIQRVKPAVIFADPDRIPGISTLDRGRNVQLLDIQRRGIYGTGPSVSCRLSELDPSESKDEALILCTSGTAGAPKLVSHTHRGLFWCAAALAEHLHLDSKSRTLNPIPLTYSHGLVAATLSSLAAGASVVCKPTTDPEEILSLIEEYRPTWYVAVPTVHQAIVRHVQARDRCGDSWPLNFVSSAGAAMPGRARRSLEDVFGVPVIERYAQTESPVIACNGFIDDYRPGTVGRPIGCELALLTATGVRIGSEAIGESGEILVRGPGVMKRYVGDEEATATAIKLGWLHTGDLGSLDEEGFLSIRGRIKEQIIRGGLNVSPIAVEEVLASHPRVLSAMVFGVPHPTLGEEIVAAVVPDPANPPSESELRIFVHGRVGTSRAPKHVLLVDDLPTGPSGKIDRFGKGAELLRSLVPREVVDAAPARSALEAAVAAVMANVLELRGVGPDDDFFLLGGDSLSTVSLQFDVEQVFARSFDLAEFIENPTAAHLASILTIDSKSTGTQIGTPAVIQAGTDEQAIFCILTWDTNLSMVHALLPALGKSRPVYSSSVFSLCGESVSWGSVEQAADSLLAAIRRVQPVGPYLLCGRSFAGLVAYEVAQKLASDAEEVSLVVLFDTWAPGSTRGRVWRRVRLMQNWISKTKTMLRAGTPDRRAIERVPIGSKAQNDLVRSRHKREIGKLQNQYKPAPTTVPVALFRTLESRRVDRLLGWRGYFRGPFEVRDVPGTHRTMLDQPQASVVAAHLADCLTKVGTNRSDRAGSFCDDPAQPRLRRAHAVRKK